MQSTITSDTLRQVPLFAGLSGEQLAWISGKSMKVYLRPGQKIASQGDPPDGFYVILEDQTEWTSKVGGQEATQRATRERREVSR